MFFFGYLAGLGSSTANRITNKYDMTGTQGHPSQCGRFLSHGVAQMANHPSHLDFSMKIDGAFLGGSPSSHPSRWLQWYGACHLWRTVTWDRRVAKKRGFQAILWMNSLDLLGFNGMFSECLGDLNGFNGMSRGLNGRSRGFNDMFMESTSSGIFVS